MIKQRLGIDAVLVHGATGQFDVMVDGEKIAERGGNWLSRSFGGGYPDLESVVERLKAKQQGKG